MKTDKEKAITKIKCALACLVSNPKSARLFLEYAIKYLEEGEEQ
jgi:hypothetical protein